ncbi:MAG: NusA-like transcription termination signal-binding factor [Candidatus Korarchaeota archaeon]
MQSEKFTLSNEELSILSTFSALSGVPVVDCIIDNEFNRVIILVEEGYISAAIGKNGEIVKTLAKSLQKDIEIIEFSENPEEFLKKMFIPAHVNKVEVTEKNGEKTAHVYVEPAHKRIAIGKNGKTVARARLIASRHLGINKVYVD